MTVKFIVDTDSYSGNFEREMCSFMTGARDGTNVGKKDAQIYLEEYETPLDVLYVQTDFGMSPVRIIPTPGYLNNEMGFHYKEGQEELALEMYKAELIKEINKDLERINQIEKIHSKVDFNSKREKLKKELEEISYITEFTPYPAYMSIQIEFKNLPESVVQILKERAETFAKRENIKITNFRVERESTT